MYGRGLRERAVDEGGELVSTKIPRVLVHTEFRLNVKSAKYEQLDSFRKRVTDFMICHFRCDVGTSS